MHIECQMNIFFLFDHCGILQLALVDLCWVKQKRGAKTMTLTPYPGFGFEKPFSHVNRYYFCALFLSLALSLEEIHFV